MAIHTDYVCGFLFSTNEEEVALIHKARPKWQKGKLNGIGGHIERGEKPLAAMRREFHEETGVMVRRWKHFCTLSGSGYGHDGTWTVYFYTAKGSEALRSTTDEAIVWLPWTGDDPFLHLPTVPNLKWLIPMAHGSPIGLCGKVWPFVVQESNDTATHAVLRTALHDYLGAVDRRHSAIMADRNQAEEDATLEVEMYEKQLRALMED